LNCFERLRIWSVTAGRAFGSVLGPDGGEVCFHFSFIEGMYARQSERRRALCWARLSHLIELIFNHGETLPRTDMKSFLTEWTLY